jgi:hypothetical protein
MKPIHVLILVLVAAAATALVYMFSREAPTGESAGAPTRIEAPAQPRGDAASVEKPAELPPEPERASTTVASEKDDDEPEAQLPVANTVVGVVLNQQDAGIPNARVQLSRDALMGEAIAMVWFANREQTGQILETVTDANGRYKFIGVEPGRDYYVMATHPDYAQVQEEGMNVGRQGEFRSPDLVLREGSKLRGYVTNVEGDALANAELHLDSAYSMGVELQSPDRLSVTTDANGFYEFKNIAAGPRVLTCWSDGYARETHHQKMFTGEASDVQEQNFRLNIGNFLAGRVFGPQGEGVAKAKVIAMNYGASTQSRGEGLTDDDGNFQVDGLGLGSYILMVQAVGYRPQSHTRVQVGDLNVQIPMLKQAELTGRVLEAGTDKPVTKFKARLLMVAVGIPNQGNQLQFEATHNSAEANPSADGSFTLLGVNPGTYAVKVIANGYATRTTDTFQVVEGLATPPLTIYVTKGGSIKGRIVDASTGRGVVGAQVASFDGDVPAGQFDPFFENLGATRATERKARSGDDGQFELKMLTAGRYRLKIEHPDFTGEWVENVVVTEGQAAEAGSVSLKPGGTMSGKVIEASGKPCTRGWVRMFQIETGEMYQARTDGEGRYSIPHVRPGSYRVSATRASGAGVDAFDSIAEQQQSEVTIEIGDGQTVQRDLQLAN